MAILKKVWQGICAFFRKPFGPRLTAAFYLLCPIASFYLLEFLTHNPFEDIHPGLHIFSWVLYLLFYTVCFFLIGHMSGAFCLSTVLVAVLGMVNYYTLELRGSPLLPWDINSIGTAASVLDNQELTLPTEVICILCGFGLLCLIALHCQLRVPASKKRLAAVAGSAVLLISLGLSVQTDRIMDVMGIYEMPFTQGYTYRQNGFVVSFLMNARYLSVDKPEDYNVADLEETLEDAVLDAEENTTPVNAAASNKQPNIIVIMNEAFSDLQAVNDFETNQDYMPFFRSLTNNAVSGTTYVSVLGGNTANSEFEFLTGDSMAFLPTGSIPYQQYINEELPSLVHILNEQGYYSVAMHPYYATGWDRNLVYDYLGFDDMYFLNDFTHSERLRQYVSDWGMYQKIISLYNQKDDDQPLFLFGVTMQNHSGYSKEYDNFTNDIHVLDYEYKYTDTYLSLVAESDRAYEKLINYFSYVDEPTIILMFGDHQPTSLESSFFRNVLEIDPTNLSLEETALRYQTPFKIWANYNIEETSDVEISVNYLGTYLMQIAGLELSDYQQYLWGLHEELPVVTANFYKDKEGTLYSYEEEQNDVPSSYEELLEEYSALQYNHLFDTKNRLTQLFKIDTDQAS